MLFITGILSAWIVDIGFTMELFVKYPLLINLFTYVILALLILMFIINRFTSDKFKSLFKILMIGMSIYFIFKSGLVLLSIPKHYIDNWFAYQLPGAIPPVSLGFLFSIFRSIFLAAFFSILERIISLKEVSM